MKTCSLAIIALICLFVCRLASATQADTTTITVTSHAPGVTPFISLVTLNASDTAPIRSIRFSITPKPGSVTRPLSGDYSRSYLAGRNDIIVGSPVIILPVYGLYDGYTNTVTFTYTFNDGSSKQGTTTIATCTYSDPCGYKTPTVLQARTASTSLSYDFFLIKNNCGVNLPTIMDTDGAIRWVGPPVSSPPVAAAFFDNAVYRTEGSKLYRVDLDGTVTLLHDYSSLNVVDFHHNIDPGKVGLILDADTTSQFESTNIEVDSAGNVVKTFSLADIITSAMVAGGDDPSQFVHASPTDWFHNNAVTYNRADDSLIVSSRENFLICIDYKTEAIKWILGDPTKKWYTFPSLRQYALTVPNGSLPPIGQHAPSITYDQGLTLFDNGYASALQSPNGASRPYSSPRKYQINLATKTATEVWNYEANQTITSPICGSVYEDAPLNYLIDYAYVGGFAASTQYAQILGLDSAGHTVFYYQYPTTACNQAFNSFPLHLENTEFPAVGPQPLNLSTRGLVGMGDSSLIGGFIVTGTDPHTVVVRALGPSLSTAGINNAVADPALKLVNSSGTVVATNDDWQSDPGASQIAYDGLAPSNPAESATIQTLAPGAYTFAVNSKAASGSGVGLVEAYDLSPQANSILANISTRGMVGTGDQILISGFIIGNVGSDTVVVRALGPSLASAGVANPLSDPTLTVYDANGSAIATNDNWQTGIHSTEIQGQGLAPGNAQESADVLHLVAGAYTIIVNGTDGGTGIGLVEVYDLQ